MWSKQVDLDQFTKQFLGQAISITLLITYLKKSKEFITNTPRPIDLQD